MRVFVTTKREAPMEDLGKISVSPKPVRLEMVHFQYKGRPAVGIVVLIDPHNWENRPWTIPKIYVRMSEDEYPAKKDPAGAGPNPWRCAIGATAVSATYPAAHPASPL
jgi:hypothetical protein